MIRRETRCRARALQMLYAWELQGVSAMHDVATGIARITGPESRIRARVGNGSCLNACEHRSNGATGGSWMLPT